MIGLLILAFALASLTTAYVTSIRFTTTANNHMRAVHIARGQLEDLTSLGYNHKALNPGNNKIKIGKPAPSTAADWNDLEGYYRVDIEKDASNPEVVEKKNIEVGIDYRNTLTGSTSTVTLKTSIVSALH